MAQLRIGWSGFESCPGSLCCVLGQDALLSLCAGGNSAMD